MTAWVGRTLSIGARQSVRIGYPPSAALTVILPAAVGLGVVRFVALRSHEVATFWPLLVVVWVGATAFNSWWLLWGSAVTFDRPNDQVRHGLRVVGRVSDIVAVARTSDPRAPIAVEFSNTVQRLGISGLSSDRAAEIGQALAAVLRVPFR